MVRARAEPQFLWWTCFWCSMDNQRQHQTLFWEQTAKHFQFILNKLKTNKFKHRSHKSVIKGTLTENLNIHKVRYLWNRRIKKRKEMNSKRKQQFKRKTFIRITSDNSNWGPFRRRFVKWILCNKDW